MDVSSKIVQGAPHHETPEQYRARYEGRCVATPGWAVGREGPNMLQARSLVCAAWLLCGIASVQGCGDSSSGGTPSGSGVVSCDIRQSGLHWCQEVRGGGSGSGDTGCPKNMTGYTPGTGCSREDVAGTCSLEGEAAYEVFFYGSGAIESAAAAICPNGTFEPTTPTGGGGSSGGGSPATPEGTCADLLACCNMASDALKDSCLTVYMSALKSGDKACAGYLPLYKLANNCP